MKTNAGGGDYTGLPTKPIQHRTRTVPEGLPWDQLTDQYVAAGGQVDAGVWPKHNGKVTILGTQAKSHKLLHTVIEAEGDDYETTLAQGEPKAAASRAQLTPAQQRTVALEYRQGGTIQGLADKHGVSFTAIRTALRKQNEPTRSRGEAQRLRYGGAA